MNHQERQQMRSCKALVLPFLKVGLLLETPFKLSPSGAAGLPVQENRCGGRAALLCRAPRQRVECLTAATFCMAIWSGWLDRWKCEKL